MLWTTQRNMVAQRQVGSEEGPSV